MAIIEGNMSTTEAAHRFKVSTRWVRKLLQRYHEGGLAAVDPQSKAPRSNPHQYTDTTITQILSIRDQLTNQGLDNGPHSIWLQLPQANRPSVTTIWRILKRHNLITPQPQKRPRSSWIRFQADLPNECWQSDFTHWPLADGTDTEIITWLDDHSRYLLHVSAHPRITTPIVIETFTHTSDIHALPASTLTDNGMVYTPNSPAETALTPNPTASNNSSATYALHKRTADQTTPPHKAKSSDTTKPSKNGYAPNHQLPP